MNKETNKIQFLFVSYIAVLYLYLPIIQSQSENSRAMMNFSLGIDDIMFHELGFDPFREHDINETEIRTPYLTHLMRNLKKRRGAKVDAELPQPQNSDFRRNAGSNVKRNQDPSIHETKFWKNAFTFKKTVARMKIMLNQRLSSVDQLISENDEFEHLHEAVDKVNEKLTSEKSRSGSDAQKEDMMRLIDEAELDSYSRRQMPNNNPMIGAMTNFHEITKGYANDVFTHHNNSWTAVTRRAKQLLLEINHSWIYRARFNLIYAQRMRWRMNENFRYRLGFCHSLLRIISADQTMLYYLVKRLFFNEFSEKYHHLSHFILRAYDKISRLHKDALDLIHYLKILEAYRKLDEEPDFYLDMQSSKSPLWK